MNLSYQFPWQVPFGEFSLRFDSLSLVFLLAITILVVCAAIYGVGYMRSYKGKKPLGLHIFFYLLLTLTLVLIVTANNIILFLGAWEAMTLSTYFLIVFHDEKESVRKAGFLYLVMAHCGTFCLFLMFFLMARFSGSMDFDAISCTSFPLALSGTIFLLALVGFGVKAGFFPIHIWLPHAHPAAPSHVSALLSGVAIKMGIYGICRVLWMMGVLPDWCGYLLLAIGVVSGVMGVLYALGQHELKKLLAYHSIENIGIIALGLGLGLLGRSYHMPLLAVIGFSGGLLHVLNHSLFKGLLFLGAGSIIQQTHTGEMDRMGGLAKIMPVTSVLFLVGALSICGLPLFNGFISEFIIYFGLFNGLVNLPLHGVVACALGIVSLAFMGALALACFTKVYGTVFSGSSRSPAGTIPPEDPSVWMLAPMTFLALLCIWIGLAPKTVVQLAFRGAESLARFNLSVLSLNGIFFPLSMIVNVAFMFLGLVVVLVLIRKFLLGPLPMPLKETWSCGFSQSSPRFQYTSSSFAYPLINFLRGVLCFRRHGTEAVGHFPGKSHVSSSVQDASEENVFRPVSVRLTNLSRMIDNKRIRFTQIYLIYIFLFLIFLLIWKLR